MFNYQNGNRLYRDALFKRIFGREDHKDYALSLYNAINNSNYDNPNEIIINTLEDVLYMKVKNDISFLLNQSMVLFEQQSTWNPNMPYRMLEYIYTEWKGIIGDKPYDIYMPQLIKLPAPQCIVFYNGKETKDFKEELKLSDLYEGKQKGCLELTAKDYNINGNSESVLLKQCRPLYEYTWIIDHIKNRLDNKESLKEAINEVIDSIPNEFTIRSLLHKEKSEVLSMLLTEFDEKKYKEAVKRYEDRLYQEANENGLKEGIKQGINQTRKETCLNLLKINMSIENIIKVTGLSRNEIELIANENK